MKWVPVYLLTSLVTGLHNFYGLMGLVNGARLNVLNCFSLLGSALLMGTAVLLSLRPHAAAKVGFVGSLLCWVYYAPLVVVCVVFPFSASWAFQFDFSHREYVPLVGMLIGPVLLILCTANSILRLRRDRAAVRTLASFASGDGTSEPK